MTSITVQSGFRTAFTCPSITLTQSSHLLKPLKPTVSALKQRAFSLTSSTATKCKVSRRRFGVVSSSAATVEAVVEDEPVEVEEEEEEEEVHTAITTSSQKGVPAGKPRIVLKFVWMEKNIGLALDQVLPGHGTVPLSPYFFWPRKDAWEELKTTLENKPWISQKKMIILLNQATDIINLWQQSGGNLPSSS